MTTHFRTLLLLGFTALSVSLSGCILETTSDGKSSGSCLNLQYFEVDWLVDNGDNTARLPCGTTPNTSVELILRSGTTYVIDGVCTEAYHYNWSGVTQAGVAAGDYVTSFRLLRTDNGAELSPGGLLPGPSPQNPSIPACANVVLTYEFPLM